MNPAFHNVAQTKGTCLLNDCSRSHMYIDQAKEGDISTHLVNDSTSFIPWWNLLM